MWTYPIGVLWKKRDHAPVDTINNGDWWRSNWLNAFYELLGTIPSRHTGDDIVIMDGVCYGDPVYAIGDGAVILSRDIVGTTWRQMIVLSHDDNGKTVYSRYAHLKDRFVSTGDKVKCGELIGHIGNAEGALPAHLHHDISTTDILRTNPTNWPSSQYNDADAQVFIAKNYVDPLAFLKAHGAITIKELQNMSLFNGVFHPSSALITAWAKQSDGSLAPVGAYDGGSTIVFDADAANGVTWQGLGFLLTSDGRYVFSGDVIQGSAYVPPPPAPPVQPAITTVKKYVTADALHVRTAANFSASSLVLDGQTNAPVLLPKDTPVNVVSTPTTDSNGIVWWRIDPAQAPMGGYWLDGQWLSDTAPNS